MKTIYGFYRKERIEGSKDLGTVSLNGGYPINFYAKAQYGDYIEAGIISIEDSIIPENRYTKEVVPGVKDLREFAMLTYDETVLDDVTINKIVNRIGQRFDLELLTPAEAIAFVQGHTDLVLAEGSTNKFVIHPAYADGIDGQPVPAKYLEIV